MTTITAIVIANMVLSLFDMSDAFLYDKPREMRGLAGRTPADHDVGSAVRWLIDTDRVTLAETFMAEILSARNASLSFRAHSRTLTEAKDTMDATVQRLARVRSDLETLVGRHGV